MEKLSMLYKDFLTKVKSQYQLSADQLRDLDWLTLDILGKDELGIFGLGQRELSNQQCSTLLNGIKRLLADEPLAYIIGNAEFYGRKFLVNKDVLIPRPETEQLCEKIIRDCMSKTKLTQETPPYTKLNILELCTGSGCIAVTLAKELRCKVTAVDISQKALDVARQNSKIYNTDIKFLQSNMWENVEGQYDIIVSNPPYIEKAQLANLPNSVKNYEPQIALDGGADGLYFYKIILKNVCNYLKPSGTLYLEIGYNQGQSLASLLRKSFEFIEVLLDYNGLDRIVKAYQGAKK